MTKLRTLTIGLVAALLYVGALGRTFAAEVKKPEMIARGDWAAETAKRTMMNCGVNEHTTIIVHHVSVPVYVRERFSSEEKARILQGGHMYTTVKKKKKPYWGDVAYHYYIDVNGKILEGRTTECEGDSYTTYQVDKAKFLMVVLEGKFSPGWKDRPEFEGDKPSEKQLASLDAIVAWLAQEHRVNPANIRPHCAFANTDCAGKFLIRYLPDLRERTARSLDYKGSLSIELTKCEQDAGK